MGTILLSVLSCLVSASAPIGQTDSTQTAAADSVYRQVELGEVKVDGRTAIQKEDHINYMPTKRQVEASGSGIALLSRMMIPKLVVNRVSGTVANIDNTVPGIYIDNRKADVKEADRLRPKDIVRVEYYDRPSSSFPGETTVLNFITRKYDRGGYVDARTATYLYPVLQGGTYTMQASFDTKRLNFTMLAGADHGRDDSPGTTSVETVALPTAFTRQSTPLDRLTKNRTYYGKLRTTYRTDKATAYVDVGLNWAETPLDRRHASVAYSPAVYDASEFTSLTESRNASPSAQAFVELRPREGRMLRMQASYVHGDNTYSREYTEGLLAPVLTDTREKTDRGDLRITYSHDLGHKNSFTLFLMGVYNSSRANYIGTMAANQQVDDGGLQFLPRYSHRLGDKLTLTAQAGLYWNVYKIGGYGTVSRLFARPIFNASYTIGPRSSAYFSWAMGSSGTDMAIYNNTEQRLNQYTVVRGNPALEIMNLNMINAGYNLSLSNFNLSLYGNCNITTDLMNTIYLTEGETLVKTYATGGKFIDYMVGGSAQVNLFDRSLQLICSLGYSGERLTGVNAGSNGRVSFTAYANYYCGDFSFYGQYIAKRTSLLYDGSFFSARQYYVFGLSWHCKNFTADAFCQNVFDANYVSRSWANYGVYSFDSSTTNALYGRIAQLRLTYSFDFGRKKVKREKLDVDRGSSGIMKL